MSGIGVLIALLIMGGMAVAVLSASGGSGTTNLPTLSGLTTVAPPADGASPPAGNAISLAQQSACRTNFSAVQQAVAYYESLNGQAPRNMVDLGSILRSPVSTSAYSITIDPHRPGEIDVSTDGHPAMAGDANCAFA